MKMERKNARTARDAVEGFLNKVYLDPSVKQGCVIESWQRDGIVSVVYEDGRVDTFNDLILGRLRVAGSLEGLADYKKRYVTMDDDEKTQLRNAIKGLAAASSSLTS